jgi:tight adherence protein C
MVSIIAISSFLFVAFAVMCVYMFAFRGLSPAAARLRSLDPDIILDDVEPQVGFVERVAAPINRLLPPSATEAHKLQKQMLQAGFRSYNAAIVFRAIQLSCTLLFPGAVILLCILFRRPVNNMFIWGMLALAIGFYLPRYILRKRIAGRQQRITWGLADALDLLVVTVEAGMGLNAALVRVGEELKAVHPEVHEEFELTNLEIRVGRGRDEALRNLAERTGVDDLRSLVAMMIQADRFGSSIARAVRVHAEALRTKRRQRAEELSQKAALKLLFPLTCFLFPTLFIFVLGPTVLNLIDLFSNK